MNNAKNYMDAAKTAAASITGALKPKGTVAFANLPNINSVESGAMYNISTAFTSNSIFKDGGNITYPAGTNVYKTEDGMWDCLGGELSDYLMKADVDTAVEEAMPDYTASSTLQELVAGESIKSAFGKIKTAIKNVIALVKMMGTTDISKIGNGTVTGAISTQASSISALNSNIVIEHYKFDLVNGEYVGQKDYSFNKSVKKNGYSAIGIVQYSLDGDYSTWMMITQQSLVNDIYHIRIRGYTDFSINSLLFIYVSILYMKNT